MGLYKIGFPEKKLSEPELKNLKTDKQIQKILFEFGKTTVKPKLKHSPMNKPYAGRMVMLTEKKMTISSNKINLPLRKMRCGTLIVNTG